jgi:hypothetical protein
MKRWLLLMMLLLTGWLCLAETAYAIWPFYPSRARVAAWNYQATVADTYGLPVVAAPVLAPRYYRPMYATPFLLPRYAIVPGVTISRPTAYSTLPVYSYPTIVPQTYAVPQAIPQVEPPRGETRAGPSAPVPGN